MESEWAMGSMVGFLVFAGLFTAAFFFSQTGLVADDFYSFSFLAMQSKIISWNFVFFLASIGFVGGIIGAAAKVFEKGLVSTAVVVGGLIGGLVGVLGFGLTAFAIPAIALWVGLSAGVWSAFSKKEEAKSFVAVRTSLSAAGTIGVFLAIGLLLWGVMTLVPMQKDLENRFLDSMIEMGLSGATGSGSLESLSQQVAVSSAKVAVESQTALLDQLISTTAFNQLKENSDSASAQFVAVMTVTQTELSSPAYLQKVENEFAQAAANAQPDETLISESVRGMLLNNQWLRMAVENLAIIWSIGLLFSCLFLNSLIIRPAGALFGAVFSFVLDQFKGITPAKPQ